jgi:hypothetical protein
MSKVELLEKMSGQGSDEKLEHVALVASLETKVQ